jgi:hypothetical protein
MPSPLITEEQAIKQKKALQEYNEKRRAAGNIGKQKSLTAKVKDLLPSALENIKAVVEGEPLTKKRLWLGTPEEEAEIKATLGNSVEFIKEGKDWYRIDHYHVDKTQYDASKWVVTNAMTLERHNFELKKLRISAKKAEAEANAGGYGDNSSAALKAKANEDGTPKLSLAYNPEWDKQRKITDDIPEDEDEYEYDEEDIDE